MTKREFLSQLEASLSKLPRADRERTLDFYSEWLDDSMEEGLSEAEAVAKLGRPEMVAATVCQQRTRADNPPPAKNRGRQVWQIILIALGSPLWLSLGAAVLAVLLAVFAAVWSVALSLWAVAVAFGAGSLCGLLLVALGLFEGQLLHSLCCLGAALVLAGLFFPALYGCLRGTVLLARLSAAAVRGLAGLFRKGERA